MIILNLLLRLAETMRRRKCPPCSLRVRVGVDEPMVVEIPQTDPDCCEALEGLVRALIKHRDDELKILHNRAGHLLLSKPSSGTLANISDPWNDKVKRAYEK